MFHAVVDVAKMSWVCKCSMIGFGMEDASLEGNVTFDGDEGNWSKVWDEKCYWTDS